MSDYNGFSKHYSSLPARKSKYGLTNNDIVARLQNTKQIKKNYGFKI
jgi:hypothetical protein